jgi:hypothetical protein
MDQSSANSPYKTEVLNVCLKRCLDAYKDCWVNILDCLKKGDTYISSKNLAQLYSSAEVCESNLLYLVYNSNQFISSAMITNMICTNTVKLCQKFDEPLMDRCAQSMKLFADSCQKLVPPAQS